MTELQTYAAPAAQQVGSGLKPEPALSRWARSKRRLTAAFLIKHPQISNGIAAAIEVLDIRIVEVSDDRVVLEDVENPRQITLTEFVPIAMPHSRMVGLRFGDGSCVFLKAQRRSHPAAALATVKQLRLEDSRRGL